MVRFIQPISPDSHQTLPKFLLHGINAGEPLRGPDLDALHHKVSQVGACSMLGGISSVGFRPDLDRDIFPHCIITEKWRFLSVFRPFMELNACFLQQFDVYAMICVAAASIFGS